MFWTQLQKSGRFLVATHSSRRVLWFHGVAELYQYILYYIIYIILFILYYLYYIIYIIYYYFALLLQSFTQCRTCHSGHFFELNGCQKSANLRTAELLRSFSEAVEVGIVMDPEPKDVWHQNLACFSCTFLYLFAFFGFNSCVAAIGFHMVSLFFLSCNSLITSNDTRWFLCWDPHGSIESCSREPPSRGAAIDLHDTYSYVHVYNMYTYIRHMPLMCGSRVT